MRMRNKFYFPFIDLFEFFLKQNFDSFMIIINVGRVLKLISHMLENYIVAIP